MDAKSFRVRARKLWREEFRPLLIMALVVFAVRSSFADWNTVPTGSMKPTILEGDRIFVNKVAYDLKVPFTTLHLAEWSAPQRGDIVVFIRQKMELASSNAPSACPATPSNFATINSSLTVQLSNINRSPTNCFLMLPQAIAPVPFTPPKNFLAARIWWPPFRAYKPSEISARSPFPTAAIS